jgi:hypothetical protein
MAVLSQGLESKSNKVARTRRASKRVYGFAFARPSVRKLNRTGHAVEHLQQAAARRDDRGDL